MRDFREPVLTTLLDAPRISAAILGAGALHVGLCAAGLGGWPCPFYQATGWPCPGCGLGRACALLLRGDWRASFRVHAFAPLLLLALCVLATGLVLGNEARQAFRIAVRSFEAKTRFSAVSIIALLAYWFFRLVIDGPLPPVVVQ